MAEHVDAPCRRRKQARPRELLDAALALFVEKGFAAARAEDIAARAGVSKATLYLYFRSKEELLMALMAERFTSRLAIDAHEPSDARTSPELLRDVLTTWCSALMESQAGGIFKLVLTEVHNFPGLADFWSQEVIEPARRLVSGIVARGIERGEFRPVDPDLVVHALVLRPLPFPQSDELVRLYCTQPEQSDSSPSEPETAAWGEETAAFSGVTGFHYTSVNRTGGELPERHSAARVTPNFLAVVGVSPVAGRPLAAEDALPGAAPTALISYTMATRLFATAEAATVAGLPR